MSEQDPKAYFGKASVSKAIYGLVTVMAVLEVMAEHPPGAWGGAATLFGTTLAVALAEAYAETIAGTLSLRRSLSREELHEVWHDTAPVMVGAQAPTFVFLLAAVGLFSVPTAIDVAAVVALLLLFSFGYRIGQTLHGTPLRSFVNGLTVAAIGVLIVAIKALFH